MPEKMPFVSVIVLNWNGKRFLEQCIGSLLNQNYSSYEVLLVDNASVDGSIEYVTNLFSNTSKLRILTLKENYGFSKGNNVGIKTCVNSDYVLILNNDTKVEPDFVSELVKVAEKGESVGSVGCKILSPDGNVWFSQKFTNGGFIVPFLLQTLISKSIEEISSRYTFNLSNSGCAALLRKTVIDKIGGYDEDYRSNWEDWDLGYRINLAGFNSVYVPKPLVIHVGGGSEGYSPERCIKIYRNMLYTYFKNYDSNNLLLRFPVMIFIFMPCFHLGWIVNRLIQRQVDFYGGQEFSYLLSLPRATFSFLANLKVFAKKRQSIQQLRKTSDKEVFLRTHLKQLL
jgi:GT2 family glycosyltransferase